MIERSVSERYRGSTIGIGWSVLQPMMMLGIYSFIFSTVFKSRWTNAPETGTLGYALNMFAGIIVFNIAAESIGGAVSCVRNNKSYVKKLVFPLEILAATIVGSGVVQGLIGLLVLVSMNLIATGKIHALCILTPIAWIPLVMTCLGVTWILSSIGTYIKDTEIIIPPLISSLMFLSAVFYPISALPGKAQSIVSLNIVALAIEETRQLVLVGELPDLKVFIMASLMSIIFAEFGYRIFKKLEKGFADVV